MMCYVDRIHVARTGTSGRLLSVSATISFSRNLLHSSYLVRPSYILLLQEYVRPGIFKNLSLQGHKFFSRIRNSMAPNNINGTRSAQKVFNSGGGVLTLILKTILQKSCHKYKCNITFFVTTYIHTYIYMYINITTCSMTYSRDLNNKV